MSCCEGGGFLEGRKRRGVGVYGGAMLVSTWPSLFSAREGLSIRMAEVSCLPLELAARASRTLTPRHGSLEFCGP